MFLTACRPCRPENFLVVVGKFNGWNFNRKVWVPFMQRCRFIATYDDRI